MGGLKRQIFRFFSGVDYKLLGGSLQEVITMTFLAILPVLINITISAIITKDIPAAMNTKIIPGEILSYCLSFISPSLYLIIKTHGSSYKLPFLQGFFMVAFLIYVASLILYLLAKNGWVPEVNFNPYKEDFYFNLSLIFLMTTIIFRIYSVYHGKRSSTYNEERKEQQNNFNEQFRGSINS